MEEKVALVSIIIKNSQIQIGGALLVYCIRPATRQDMPYVFQIEKLSFVHYFPYHLLESLRHEAKDLFLVYEQDDCIIGYTVAILPNNDAAHLVSIAVHPNFRRRGIATRLIKELLKRLCEKGISYVYLEVDVMNEAAIKLYQKLGFTIVERISSYYENGHDAYLMILFLQKSNNIRKNNKLLALLELDAL